MENPFGEDSKGGETMRRLYDDWRHLPQSSISTKFGIRVVSSLGTILFLVQIIFIVQLIYFLSEIVTSPWIDPHQIVGKKPDIVEGSSIK